MIIESSMGAIGFDREVWVREACRGTANPKKGRSKYNCRLSRVRISRVRRLHHLNFFPALSLEWCNSSRIVFLDTYTERRNPIGMDGRKPVSGCSVIRDQNTD